MAEFKSITTQEEFDERIKERIGKVEKKVRDEYKDWISPDKLVEMNESHSREIEKINKAHADELAKYAGYDEKFTAQEKEINTLRIGAMKAKIANAKKLPYDAIEFLTGEDEESISDSADRLAKLSARSNPVYSFTRDTEEGNSTDVWRDLARNFNKE